MDALTLSKALRLTKTSAVGLVGSGGKTTTLFQLARELSPALLATSTHLGRWQISPSHKHLTWQADTPRPEMDALLEEGSLIVTAALNEANARFGGLTPAQLRELQALAREKNISLLIEADGSHHRALKAPAEHEPALPEFVDTVIVVAGLGGLDKPLDGQTVHRPEIFSKLSGLRHGKNIYPEAVVRVLSHPEGGLKNIPGGARKVALLTQAETEYLQAAAGSMARELLRHYDAVVITRQESSLESSQLQPLSIHEPVAGVVLAAGGSTRYGKPKQLLDFRGQPFVRVVAETALKGGLSPVVVVTGADAEQVQAALVGLPNICIVHNPHWQEGQSTSLKRGLEQVEKRSGGTIFLLADQPQVPPEVLRALAENHAQNLAPVLAPYVFDQRANPVLFDRITYPALRQLSGDVGGRAIFSQFSPRYVNWYDRRLLLDVDTSDDYAQVLLGKE